MTEHKREYCKPHYKNEVLLFEKETLQKVEEFRFARSNWVTTYTNQVTNTNTTEGFYESNVYKGRCKCLRKIGFKTTYLRVHHKSLRPLKYYTCRRKLPDSDIVRTDSQEILISSTEESQSHVKFKKRYIFMRGGYPLGKKGSKESYHSCPKIKPENATDYFEEDFTDRKKSKWERRKKRRDERRDARLGPSKKAIKKLKAAHFESGVVESCKCDDGRELTVVIKGFCFCDRNSLNKLKLNKVRDEYSKMTNITTAPDKKLLPHLANALDAPEKNTSEMFIQKNNDELKKEDEKENLTKSDSKKKLALEEPSDFEKLKDVEKPKEVEKLKNAKELNNVEKPKEVEKLKNAEELKDAKKFEQKFNSEDLSTVTLFKNTQQERSAMALTKEQFEKMKESSEEEKNNSKISKKI